jgi:hypothetical protein
MRISQLHTSFEIANFGLAMKNKYGLSDYLDRYAPAFFFGCYTKNDLETVLSHKSFAVIIWGGSDTISPTFLNILKNQPRSRNSNIYHIAISSYIAEDLHRIWLPYHRFNIYPNQDELFRPEPLGRKVYMYSSNRNSNRKTFYGFDYLETLKKQLPDVTFIEGFGNPKTLPFEKMAEIYKECAIGLRLVPHDGCSCTVVELALMGRKCVWNGSFPNAINYRTLDDVVRAIRTELENVGTVNRRLSQLSRKAISDTKWLHLETFTNRKSVLEADL